MGVLFMGRAAKAGGGGVTRAAGMQAQVGKPGIFGRGASDSGDGGVNKLLETRAALRV